MNTAIARRPQLLASEEIIEGATETALFLPAGISEIDWAEVGEKLGRAHRASAWWIGDWINYGEGAGYVSREKYELAQEITGMAPKTLRNYAAISRAFESSRRRDDLGFGHHATVVALPESERDLVLDQAADESWTLDRLRSETRTKPTQSRVSPNRRHESVVEAARAFVKVVEPWDAEMASTLGPPEARKQLTVLNKAAERLAEVIAAVEYRAATPHRFMGR